VVQYFPAEESILKSTDASALGGKVEVKQVDIENSESRGTKILFRFILFDL
jgi:hypothetical protein